MMLNVPFSAPSLPPLTGVSSIEMPRSARFAAISRVAFGLMVLASMTSAPVCAP
jgi:hypothetical protein